MKRTLLYGRTTDKVTPWYDGFQVSPDGSLDSHISGVDTFEIGEDQEIRWIDIFNAKMADKISDQERFEAKQHRWAGL